MRYNQLHLIPTIIKKVELVADSRKNAFYNLMIEEHMGKFAIVKESGCDDKVRDRRRWVMRSAKAALERYEKILREKLDPARASPRKYKKRRLDQSRRINDDFPNSPSNIKTHKIG